MDDSATEFVFGSVEKRVVPSGSMPAALCRRAELLEPQAEKYQRNHAQRSQRDRQHVVLEIPQTFVLELT